ncbi:methyl-accepting chemotaxis protein [Azospirillum sp. sgz302134]
MTIAGLSIRAKLFSLIAIAGAASLAIAFAALRANYAQMYEDRVASLRHLAETVHSLAESYEAEVRAGAMTREEAINQFRKRNAALRFHGAEYFFMQSMDGVMLAHGANPKLDGRNMLDVKDPNGVPITREVIRAAQQKGGGTLEYHWPRPGSEQPVEKVTYAIAFAPWNAAIGVGVYIDDLRETFWAMVWKLGLVVAAFALPTVALLALVGARLSADIRRLSSKMMALAGGDMSQDFAEAGRGDEIGAMGKAVLVFKRNAEEKVRLERDQEVAARRAEEEKRRGMRDLAASFEQSVGKVVRSVAQAAAEVERRAQAMSTAADRTNSLSNTVATATGQTSANVQTVASATEELSGSIQEISRQVAESAKVTGEAVTLARNANGRVSGLAEAVEKIGAVVHLINEIASQTNLLALNATIEAARAGEAGKGFAVVASEVKALATQTARATEEIGAQVSNIQTVTGDAVEEIQRVAGVIERVSEISATIASAVEEQGSATREISRNIQEASSGTREVAATIAGVTGAADESGRTAHEVLRLSNELSGQVQTLDREVGAFVKAVSAG